jgi:uncharacterized membrane protein
MYSDDGGYRRHRDDDSSRTTTITVDDSEAANKALKASFITLGIVSVFFSIFAFIWVIIGIIAFLASLVCMFYQGSPTDKAVGLLLAIITGPFYWLYYIYNMNYCTRSKNY